MENKENCTCRHYVTYSGVKLPLKLVSPIEDETLDGRITYIRAYYDKENKLVGLEKVVYDEVEFEHHYTYYPDGRIKSAVLIEPDQTPRAMSFD